MLHQRSIFFISCGSRISESKSAQPERIVRFRITDIDYAHGFLIACDAAGLLDANLRIDEVVVIRFDGADKELLNKLVELALTKASKSEFDKMLEFVKRDLGMMRTYFEDRHFSLFGSLDRFEKVPLPESDISQTSS